MTNLNKGRVNLKKSMFLYLKFIAWGLVTGAVFGSFFYFFNTSPNKPRTAVLIGLFPVVFGVILTFPSLKLGWKVWRASKHKKLK